MFPWYGTSNVLEENSISKPNQITISLPNITTIPHLTDLSIGISWMKIHNPKTENHLLYYIEAEMPLIFHFNPNYVYLLFCIENGNYNKKFWNFSIFR